LLQAHTPATGLKRIQIDKKMIRQMPRPMLHLSNASKLYPNAWILSDAFRRDKGVEPLPDWPDWCYCPVNGWYSIISESVGGGPVPVHLASDVGRLAALGAWRITKGIYSFHPITLDALSKTSMNGDFPSDVFFRLPEWCLYIETPDFKWFEDTLYGFFVHLDKDINDGHIELRILLDTESSLMPIILYIGGWSVLEAVSRAVHSGVLARAELSLVSAGLTRPLNEIAAMIQPLLSLVFYLCSKEPEYKGGCPPIRPKPKHTKKKGWRLFAAARPRIWVVGEETGKALNAAKKHKNEIDRSRPEPHIRRAHWHGYWTGPKHTNRRFEFRWLPPIPVNFDLLDDNQ
jgi:hypothetical protein